MQVNTRLTILAMPMLCLFVIIGGFFIYVWMVNCLWQVFVWGEHVFDEFLWARRFNV